MSKLLLPRQSERQVILRNTAIVGVSLGLFQGIIWLISSPLLAGVNSSTSLSAFFFLAAPLIWIIAFFLHGIVVGKRTGDTNQAALSGLFGGVFGGLAAAVCNVLVLTLKLNSAGADQLASVGWEAVGTTVTTMFLVVVAGTAFGALGGLIGKYISPDVSQPKSADATIYPTPPMFYYPPATAPQPNTSKPATAASETQRPLLPPVINQID